MADLTIFSDELLEELRSKVAGISIKSVCGAMDVSESLLFTFKKTGKRPSDKILMRIARYFGVRVRG